MVGIKYYNLANTYHVKKNKDPTRSLPLTPFILPLNSWKTHEFLPHVPKRNHIMPSSELVFKQINVKVQWVLNYFIIFC